MVRPKLAAKKPKELLALLERNDAKKLTEALSLLFGWGIRNRDYLPVLGMLLSHKDPEVLRLTLGIMMNHKQLPRKEFLQLKKHLPVFRELAPVQFNALELIVALSGPTEELVPHLRAYLSQWPEETCDLIVKFGPVAKGLVPDLIRIVQTDDWDEIWAAIDAIGAIGSAAEDAVPILKELTRHKSGVITGRACVALEKITGISRKSWPRGPGAG
jgi:hypothetical protein